MSEGSYSTYEVRVRAVGALMKGLPLGKVADAFSVDRTTLYRWLKRYETNGEGGLLRLKGSGYICSTFPSIRRTGIQMRKYGTISSIMN